MAYTACAAEVVASIQQDCANPNVGGYTGRGILFRHDQAPTIVTDSTNPRILKSITLPESGKFVALDNAYMATPLTDSATASNADGGDIRYSKTVSFSVPQRGADVSKDIIEPLTRNALGFVAILEKKDKAGLGSFEVVGYQQGLKANADGISRNEAENNGATKVTMSCVEVWYEVNVYDTDYATTKAAFETMLANTY